MNKFRLFDLADTLEFFEYSGSMSKITAARNALLNAKFMVSVQEKGDMDTVMVGHSMSKAVKKYCRIVFDDLKSIDSKRVFLSHTMSDEDYFSKLFNYVVLLNYFEDIITSNASNFSTSYVGPNCLKVSYQLKWKSIRKNIKCK